MVMDTWLSRHFYVYVDTHTAPSRASTKVCTRKRTNTASNVTSQKTAYDHIYKSGEREEFALF